ncbi:MAG: RNA polymerase sigma factor [Synergistales bacterium]|jgi:RNA polymerase sigma-70 factor (ECF subfamily)|nr:RNA polymerase sigma factor [Bacteroidales bacterium]MDY6435679.1 RNA polymerase sigma factor [Synergistales bacterium]MDY6393341.1 RNA polymerase sigma factor [Bacteroidales bacterium]MDY6395935.1 RNA polymerase sigma factor [Bacteroidales bacterium]MDY6402882.1 RNA polymerase sigma factor [Bacteroidales bacterium]
MTEKEYNVCVEEYSDRVFAYLVKNMQDSDSAKDVLQDSFVSLWNNRQKVEKEKSKSFLFTVAHNLMMNTFNYNKLRQQPIILEELMENRDFENKDFINYLTNLLTPIMKECLLLRDLEGFAYREIAQMMNITEENVKVNIFRARVKMRQYIMNLEKGI